MEDVTIVLQGRVSQECYDFYIKHYTKYKVIISTWVNTEINFENLPDNFIVLLSQYPDKPGTQNSNYQIVSTLNALKCISTKYTIKFRADEYWSNPERILFNLKEQPNKIHSAPVFFRHWNHINYHMSDHIIAGTTDNMKIMFENAKYNFDNDLITHTMRGKEHTFWEPEITITKSYLKAKEPHRFEKMDGRIVMVDNFNILDIELLKPYKIKSTSMQTDWYDNFVPEQNHSISKIEQMFQGPPYIVPRS
jgi:hypothetical protein